MWDIRQGRCSGCFGPGMETLDVLSVAIHPSTPLIATGLAGTHFLCVLNQFFTILIQLRAVNRWKNSCMGHEGRVRLLACSNSLAPFWTVPKRGVHRRRSCLDLGIFRRNSRYFTLCASFAPNVDSPDCCQASSRRALRSGCTGTSTSALACSSNATVLFCGQDSSVVGVD